MPTPVQRKPPLPVNHPEYLKRTVGDAIAGAGRDVLSWNSKIGAQNRQQAGGMVDAFGRVGPAVASGLNKVNPGPTPQLQTPSQAAGQGLGMAHAAAGAVGSAIGSGLNKAVPEYQGMPVKTPSQVAGQIIPTAQAIGAGIGGNITSGLNKTDPTYQGMPVRTPSQVAGAAFSGIANAITSPFSGGDRNPAVARPAPRPPTPQPPQGLVGSLPQPGLLPSEGLNPGVFAPSSPAPFTNPLAKAPMGSGMQLPGPPGPSPPSGLAARPDFPSISAPPERYNAPSGQAMVGDSLLAPQLGPAAPVGLADRGMEAVRQLQADGVLGRRIGQDPQMNQPIASDLRGPAPQAGVSGAADFYRNNGRLMTNEEAAANYRRAPEGFKYQPNTTRGGAPVPTQQEFADREQRSAERIAKQASIARQGNFRESVLADRNLRGMENVKIPEKKPEYDFGLRSSGRFETDANGRTTKKGGYSSTELQAQAGAKAKFDARRGGLEKRQQDYQDRTAQAAKDRRAGVLARASEKAAARSDTVRLRKGRATFEERLAMANPQAAAARSVGEAQVRAAEARDTRTDAFRQQTLEAQERMANERNKTATQNNRDRIAAEAELNGRPNPFTSQQGGRQRSNEDIALLPMEQRIPALVERHGEARANEILNQQNGTQGHNYLEEPIAPWWKRGQSPAPVITPPPGSTNRARMGGGMQLPSSPKPKPGSLGEDKGRSKWALGAREK